VVWSENVVLLPIHFEGNDITYYLQFDTGSPYTVFFILAIKTLQQIRMLQNRFTIGNTKYFWIISNFFEMGNDVTNDLIKNMETIGADVLENRKTLINFKESFISLNLRKSASRISRQFDRFEFKKKKIIVSGILKD
jgi:hypothetical protein